ncbi:hypothetical protein CISG_06987 [Coccidioides immitis RMSCC 3703]|uniref:Uncharacterized protein n=2 Tax=Coccidioides immitis TaxID=5501 RepID=A0A0J8R0A4_COCIT|nr:hypothetical protein CIRG_04631 [Coccidioides immitis RMSCC 2394]KMU78146.1 hypothetical protein CISG_06987 [Coccidioides immitis RMSCC 3703]
MGLAVAAVVRKTRTTPYTRKLAAEVVPGKIDTLINSQNLKNATGCKRTTFPIVILHETIETSIPSSLAYTLPGSSTLYRELRKRITEQASRHEGPKTHDDVILQRPEELASPKRHSQQMRDFKSRPSHHGVRHRCCHQNCIIVPAIDGP